MMHLNDIAIGYGRGRVVAANLTADLAAGMLTCLIGRNGTGKSTLLRTMAAMQQPLAGSITVDMGQPVDLHAMTPGQRARVIGIVLTERTAPGNMTVREMVAMGRTPYTGFWGRLSAMDREIVDEALEATGTDGMANRQMEALSDGERQKVMIAKALAQQTPLIMLDEPTAFLDYPSKISTMETLLRLCHEQGKTVLLSTHDLDAALKMTDRVWLMKEGALMTGTPEELGGLVV